MTTNRSWMLILSSLSANRRSRVCWQPVAEVVHGLRDAENAPQETRRVRHRETATQRILAFLCDSESLWPGGLCASSGEFALRLADRGDFRHGLLESIDAF